MKTALFVVMVLGLTVFLILPMGSVMALPGIPPVYTPEYYLAAHAVVLNGDWYGTTAEETAWADRNDSQNSPGAGQAWYFSYRGNPGPDNTWALYADQTIFVGRVIVAITGNDMAITFKTFAEWRLAETRLAVVLASEGWQATAQTRSGSPKVGQFAGLDGERSSMVFDRPVPTYAYHYSISP